MSAVTDQSTKMELMQLKIDRLEAQAALAAQQAPGVKRKRGPHEDQPSKVDDNLTPFANRPFCWTHGPCQHVGNICKAPRRPQQESDLAEPDGEQVEGPVQEQRLVDSVSV